MERVISSEVKNLMSTFGCDAMAATATRELDPAAHTFSNDAPYDLEHSERGTWSVTKDWCETWTFPDKQLRARQDIFST